MTMKTFSALALAVSLLGVSSCEGAPSKLTRLEYADLVEQACPPKPNTAIVNRALDEYIVHFQCYTDFYDANIDRVKEDERRLISQSDKQRKDSLKRLKQQKLRRDAQSQENK